jgi:hypothetical protein
MAPQQKRGALDSARTMTRLVECARHGPQEEAFVCQHIALSMHTRIPVGFFWPADARASRPDAWCAECEERVRQTGGEWVGQADAQLGASLICGKCYDAAKELNLRPS